MRKTRVVFAVAIIVILLLLSACSSTTQKTEPFGKPWQSTCVIGNLPPERPSVRDDLYTYYNYDILKEHQVGNYTRFSSNYDEFSDAVIEIINDPSIQGHDINQLRIMYNQTMDTETLKAIGFSEVQPYIDMIDGTKSIEEFNALLLSEDYPFSPICTYILVADNEYAVAILPDLMFFDPVSVTGDYYMDSEDPDEQTSLEELRKYYFNGTVMEFSLLSLKFEDLPELYERTVGFEKLYARFLSSNDNASSDVEYGQVAAQEAAKLHSLDSICSMCSSFPLRQLLQKEKLDNAELFYSEEEWLKALDSLWTDENLETIKWVTKIIILGETLFFRDQSVYFSVREEYYQKTPPSAEFLAFLTCDRVDTFDSLIGKLYADYVLGQQCKTRITEITEDVIRSYKKLIAQTTWLSEQTRSRIEKKLDDITLNIIEPVGGYRDFSGLKLVPTDEGGTLFSNYLRIKKYVKDQERAKLGKTVDSNIIWNNMAVSQGNAYYDALGNSINILPGIMTKEFYSADMSYEELLGIVGSTIGHEISHAFDYIGSQFDENGAFNSIFNEDELEIYLERTNKLAEYYSLIEICPSVYVDGYLVSVEALADLCGLQAALDLAGQTEGFDYEAFFKAFAQGMAQTIVPDDLIAYLLDVHPIFNVRCNVSCQMFDKTYEVYGIREGDAMYLAPDKRVLIWGN